MTFLQYVGHLLDALIGDLGNVNQAVLTRQDVDEGTEVDNALDLTGVDLADFGLGSDGVNTCLGSVGGVLAGGEAGPDPPGLRVRGGTAFGRLRGRLFRNGAPASL